MSKGTLRVYRGAAPGVGKTFAMLCEGRRRAGRGTDVVVGFVETHGRTHTAEQLADLEIVPRKTLLRLFMAQLRQKLEPDPAHPLYLHTEAGRGYHFDTTPPSLSAERPSGAAR